MEARDKRELRNFKEYGSSHLSAGGSFYRVGRFYGNKNGEGKVVVSSSFINTHGEFEVSEDVYFITKKNVKTAIDGDMVLICIDDTGTTNYGSVVSVLNRELNYVAGEVVKLGFSYYLNPADKRLSNLTITINDEVEDGDRVLVELSGDHEFNQYQGKVVETFDTDLDLDIIWEAAKCGITDRFSDDALKQVETIPMEVRDVDRVGRMDLTSEEIFTIDGDDTKDIDDAVSCRRLENGNYLVGVHIADVSYYVKEGSPLDKDAFKRSTSVYLGGQVIPMLPKELSNGICSLNPGVERLAMSCMMEIDNSGNVVNYNIWPSVIKSNIQMTYKKVNGILKEGIIPSEYEEHAETLRELNRVALLLRRKRIKEGAIEFDRPELRVKQGTDLDVRITDVAEDLIGEFMILANETVDKHLSNNGWPCLHRVHNTPSADKLSEFLNLMDAIGINYNNYSADDYCSDPKLMQKLSEDIKNMGSVSSMLSSNLIRCMSRAKYSPVNIGHNGLAKTNYCHFTSPIRRYPDLVVHRIVKDSLFEKKAVVHVKKKWNDTLADIGSHTSRMERMADEAERSVLYSRCVEYMRDHIGEDFEGVITGISNKGLSIELKNYIEGRVKMASLPGTYTFNPNNYSLVSTSGHDSYYVGDELSLKCIEANMERKTINFKVNSKIKEYKEEEPFVKTLMPRGK